MNGYERGDGNIKTDRLILDRKYDVDTQLYKFLWE